MIRSELVARIVAQNPHLLVHEAEMIVATILDTMSVALARGDRVELRGFGTFAIRETEARTGRNPLTGKAIAVEARRHVTFKPGKTIQDRLNRVKIKPEDEAQRVLHAP
jgi:integration host factor subunit beta